MFKNTMRFHFLLAGFLLVGWVFAADTDVASDVKREPTKLQFQLEDNMPVTSIVWSPDGRFIAAASTQDKRIHIWDVATRRVAHEFASTSASRGPHELTWSPDGRYLVACDGFKGRVLILDAQNWGPPKLLQQTTSGCVESAFSSDSSQLAILGSFLSLYSAKDWQLTNSLDVTPPTLEWGRGKLVKAIAYLPGTHIVVIGGDQMTRGESGDPGKIQEDDVGYLWFLKSTDRFPSVARQVYFHKESQLTAVVRSLAVRPDGSEIATGANTGTGPDFDRVFDSVRIVRTSDGSIVASPLDGKVKSPQSGIQYTPDGRFLIVGNGGYYADHVVYILDTKSYAVVGTVHAPGTIYDVAVNPTSTEFAVSAGGTISIWTLPSRH